MLSAAKITLQSASAFSAARGVCGSAFFAARRSVAHKKPLHFSDLKLRSVWPASCNVDGCSHPHSETALAHNAQKDAKAHTKAHTGNEHHG